MSGDNFAMTLSGITLRMESSQGNCLMRCPVSAVALIVRNHLGEKSSVSRNLGSLLRAYRVITSVAMHAYPSRMSRDLPDFLNPWIRRHSFSIFEVITGSSRRTLCFEKKEF